MGTAPRVLITGDSMTHGMEGDWTWRYRLWQWLRSEGVPVDFVGPYTGTQNAAPPDPSDPTGPRTTGGYAVGVEDDFEGNHFSGWGWAAWQVKERIRDVVGEHRPDVLLIFLGFNDMGWGMSDAKGTVESLRTIIDESRAVRPRLKIAVANVPQRSFIDGRQDLVDNTNLCDELLEKAVVQWSTKTSPVQLAHVKETYGTSPTKCPGAYDGLHPNALGEFQIAKAFSRALVEGFKMGKNELQIPANIPRRPMSAPVNLQAKPFDQGITVTWDRVYGARRYDVSKRMGPSGTWDLATQDSNERTTGAIELTNGQEVFYRVRVNCEADGTSAWSEIVSAVARLK